MPAAVYEWNYGGQMIAIRLAEAEGEGDRARIEHDVFSDRFLIKRPLLQALEPDPAGPPVLLVDESIGPMKVRSLFSGSVRRFPDHRAGNWHHQSRASADRYITSNRTREIHDALKRRASITGLITHSEREVWIVRAKVPGSRTAARAGGRLRTGAPSGRSVQVTGCG